MAALMGTKKKPKRKASRGSPSHGLNARQLRFAELVAAGMAAGPAYKEAGYAPGHAETHGPRLARNDQVAREIARIQAQRRAAALVSVESVTEMLRDDRRLAMLVGQAGPAVQASMGIAKLHGLLIDKAQVDITLVPKPALAPTEVLELDQDEWERDWSRPAIEHQPKGGNGNGNGSGNGHG